MQIPESSHPGWRKLVTGQTKVDLSFMAARMLLMRVVSNMGNDASHINRGVNEIRNLYVKNCDLPNAQRDIQKIFEQ